MSSTRLHNMTNFGPLAAEIGSKVWDTPANFKGFRVLASLVERRRSPEANRTLHDVWALLGCYIIYTFSAALAPRWNFATCKIHFASKSCILLYWQRYCPALQQRGQPPNFAAWYKNRITELSRRAPPVFGWAAMTLGIGPHSG